MQQPMVHRVAPPQLFIMVALLPMPQVDLATADLLADFVLDRYSTVWVKATVGAYSYQVAMVEVGTTTLELVATVPAAHSTASPIMPPVAAVRVAIQIQPPTQEEPVVVPGPGQVVQVI